MRKIAVALIIGIALCIGAGGGQSGDADPARAIVYRAIKAEGGEANLAKQKASTWKEKGTYYGMGDGLPFTGIYAIQWPDQFRMEIEGFFVLVLNGDKGWTTMGGETKEMSKDELALQRFNHKAGWLNTLLPLKDKAFQLKLVGDAKVGDEPAQVVQVTRKDYPEVKLYFAKKSGLLVKSEFRTKDEAQKDIVSASYFSDHRDVDGAKVPHKVVMKRDGKLFVEAEVSEMKAVGKLDAKVFAKPGND